MRFQKHSSPPPYLNRRDQYRMLGMVLLLLLIVVAIDFTAKPGNWAWFFQMGEVPPDEQQAELKELDLEDLDFRVRQDNGSPLPADTFIVASDPPTEEHEMDGGDEIHHINGDLLTSVVDRQVGLKRAELPALETVIERVRQVPEPELMQAARQDVGFRVLNTDSEQYRGQLIQVQGILWHFAPFSFGDPDSDADDLYQAWILTADSGNHPWFVLLTDKPAALEFGNEIDRRVTVAGYYFRQYGYPTEGNTVTVAPMLIARTLHLKPTAAAERQRTDDVSYYVVGFLGIIGIAFGAMIWWFIRSDRKFAKSHLAEIAESRLDAPPDVVANLNQLQATDPIEELRKQQDEQETKS